MTNKEVVESINRAYVLLTNPKILQKLEKTAIIDILHLLLDIEHELLRYQITRIKQSMSGTRTARKRWANIHARQL
jgi:hypothetical protein